MQQKIIIVGAGITGLALANALAQHGFEVTVLDQGVPPKPVVSHEAQVSALNIVSVRFLKHIQAWQRLADVEKTKVIDVHAWDDASGGAVEFHAKDIDMQELAWITSNKSLIFSLYEQAKTHNNLNILYDNAPLDIVREADGLRVFAANYQKFFANLVIGADGGKSWVRKHMQIPVVERPYQQESIVFIARTERPHQYRALQNFLSTGPLGILPLHDSHEVAVIWSCDTTKAHSLLETSRDRFNIELTNALNNRLGLMQAVTDPRPVPLIMRQTQQYVLENIALVGDAAHCWHPLAGQGVNFGLLDVACLLQTLIDAREKNRSIGSLRVLRRYERWRCGDNQVMQKLMMAMKEIHSVRYEPLVHLRGVGFNIFNKFSPAKKISVRYAAGFRGDLPDFLQLSSS